MSKVLVLINSFYPLTGGAEKQAQRLSKVLKKDYGQDIVILTRRYQGLQKYETIDGLSVIRVRVGKLDRIAPILYLVQVFLYVIKNKKNIKIIHAHSLSAPGISAALISKLFRIPSIAKIAGGGNKDGCEIIRMKNKKFGKIKVEFLKNNLTYFISISGSIYVDLKKVGVPENKILRIPNGINFKEYETKEPTSDIINFIYVGRHEYVKGIDVLEKAWMKLDSCYKTKAKLVVLGDGSISIDRTDGMELIGNTENVKDYLAKSDCLILPSRYEGISNALLEAIASNKYIIATNVGGNLDVLDKNCSTIINPASVSELKNAIIEVIELYYEKPNVFNEKKKKQLESVKEKYNLEKIANKYNLLYQKLGEDK
ncbi:glycosyltransferase family 4 protein [Vagococcus lutrae]|uniref:glycosyltransferase family 4 protein n=1 Tax=Vagococcus lutrae TaxID=81947 RepID=UPI00200D41B4|nr:glycosyltransferase family 4 protein [Vagococcus lutrae]UQF18028.1 glycosyltransferase family 4 protein [Vagococcus lutrae]